MAILDRIHIYAAPVGRAELLSSVSNLLGSLVSAAGTVLGISIAVLFFTAQTGSMPGRSRTVRELYRSRELILALSFFTATVIVGVLALARATAIANSGDLRLVNVAIVLTLTSFGLLIPVALLQIENMDPVLLAYKFTRRVTVKAIREYELVHVFEVNGVLNCKLVTHGLGGRYRDPLGPMHEVVMQAADVRDRLLLTQLVRVLLSPVAGMAGGRLTADPFAKPPFHHSLRRPVQVSADDMIVVSAHIMHYLVRRAANLRDEWGKRDIARHPFVTSISDLMLELSRMQAPGEVVLLCTMAVLRISLHFQDVEPWGRVEPLNRFAQTVAELDRRGYHWEASIAAEALGVINVRTKQLTPDRAPELDKTLGGLVVVMKEAGEIARTDEDWLPGPDGLDPWRSQPIPS